MPMNEEAQRRSSKSGVGVVTGTEVGIKPLIVPIGLSAPNLTGSILEDIYPIARASILKSYDIATKKTPYAASMVGKKKRSGKVIKSISPPAPPFGIDTGAFRSGLERIKQINGANLFIFSDVFYAEFLLNKFAEKGNPIQLDGIAIEAIEAKISNKIETIWATP